MMMPQGFSQLLFKVHVAWPSCYSLSQCLPNTSHPLLTTICGRGLSDPATSTVASVHVVKHALKRLFAVKGCGHRVGVALQHKGGGHPSACLKVSTIYIFTASVSSCNCVSVRHVCTPATCTAWAQQGIPDF
ncbi:TPA: hypothetical protein ACH3X1_011670 [Trebouxia sp. C0004]